MEDKKANIFNCGKAIFSSKGFKDTNISDITKMAGIAVGTFYNYYPSKEKLFIDIYLKENEKLRKSIMESIDMNDDPVKVVKEAITQGLNSMNSNPILKEWYNRDLFSKLEKEFFEEGGIESTLKQSNSGLAELIKKWKAEKKIRNDLDDEFILVLFNSISYVDIHKEEIGIRHFPDIVEYLAEFIIKGLTDMPK